MRTLVLIAMLCGARHAAAEHDCRVVDVELTPSADLQIVGWIEDAAGNYVDTAFITQATGLRGIGNRTGIMGLKSGPKWPYGPREDVLPIWAHRHGLTFPAVVWQDWGDPAYDCNMSRAFALSSGEGYFCRPLEPTEPAWDTGTCASAIYTDKGTFSDALISYYPPRADLMHVANIDSASVASFANVNPFDTIAQATPRADVPFRFTWYAPASAQIGDYVMRIEVAKEFDFNATYTESTYPTTQCAFLTFGVPYRGQPSVVYDVPFAFAATETVATTATYAGYSDLAGTVHPPDATITTDTPGSGASRLRVAIAPDGAMYRVRVATRIELDAVAPTAVRAATVAKLEPTSAAITFFAPGDDGDTGTVSGYEMRYRTGESLDDASFASATPLPAITPMPPGSLHELALADLRPYTRYVVGIRAVDNCGHTGPLVVVDFETPTVEVGCGCGTGHPAGLALGIPVLLLLRRRRRRRRRG